MAGVVDRISPILENVSDERFWLVINGDCHLCARSDKRGLYVRTITRVEPTFIRPQGETPPPLSAPDTMATPSESPRRRKENKSNEKMMYNVEICDKRTGNIVFTFMHAQHAKLQLLLLHCGSRASYDARESLRIVDHSGEKKVDKTDIILMMNCAADVGDFISLDRPIQHPATEAGITSIPFDSSCQRLFISDNWTHPSGLHALYPF